jgi:hypothetical protein
VRKGCLRATATPHDDGRATEWLAPSCRGGPDQHTRLGKACERPLRVPAPGVGLGRAAGRQCIPSSLCGRRKLIDGAPTRAAHLTSVPHPCVQPDLYVQNRELPPLSLAPSCPHAPRLPVNLPPPLPNPHPPGGPQLLSAGAGASEQALGDISKKLDKIAAKVGGLERPGRTSQWI